MENTPIDRLLHDYISGWISPEGMQELEAWSRESEENRQILDLIDGNSDLGSELSRMYRYEKERVWQAICEEDRRYMRRKRFFRTVRACAAVLLLVGVFVSAAPCSTRPGSGWTPTATTCPPPSNPARTAPYWNSPPEKSSP